MKYSYKAMTIPKILKTFNETLEPPHQLITHTRRLYPSSSFPFLSHLNLLIRIKTSPHRFSGRSLPLSTPRPLACLTALQEGEEIREKEEPQRYIFPSPEHEWTEGNVPILFLPFILLSFIRPLAHYLGAVNSYSSWFLKDFVLLWLLWVVFFIYFVAHVSHFNAIFLCANDISSKSYLQQYTCVIYWSLTKHGFVFNT